MKFLRILHILLLLLICNSLWSQSKFAIKGRVIDKETNEIVDEWVSGKEPHYFEGLEVGTYTLTEKIAPKGYELSEETIEFEVKNDGKITKVVMYNTPYTPVPITSLNANPFIIALGFILSFFGLGMVFKNVKTREE